ncbi:recombination mediator RecR [Engelhardtia mirabilis]|uniref:Recombination protein RecR n=1 Tax=Engelhardtia mirabilis TaxID=2528011 RepID=A0A518BPB0_9BACT|nr:Recombination protein RecR [Planctomycetes bacterium Pla133]QDV03135.1 Recombination protein RecR [Planctomycetes bacterium Pla86]
MAYPKALEELVEAFERFPGIGRRTAERLAFHVLRNADGGRLAEAIGRARGETLFCSVCGNLSEGDPCAICSDEGRDRSQLLVVEEPRAVEAVERSGAHGGLYHVLMGSLQPAEGSDSEHLNLGRLVERLREGAVREVILGTDPDAEGEATAMLVLEAVERAGLPVRVTRLARGLPAGSALEYLHRGVLEDALEGRTAVRTRRPDDGS